MPLFDEVCLRSAKFIVNCTVHCSDLVQFIVRQALFVTRCSTPLGRKIVQLSSRYGFRSADWLHKGMKLCNHIRQTACNNVSHDEQLVASQLHELISVRDRYYELTNFSTYEVIDLIRLLSTL